jgi:hypothetical protein
MQNETSNSLASVTKLAKDIKQGLVTVGREETRFLVDTFYQIQNYRIAAQGQIRSIDQEKDISPDKTHNYLSWYLDNLELLENELKKALGIAAGTTQPGRWAQSIKGIGPIMSAALVSAFDITKATSAGHFWSYAGLNDNNRPWIGREEAEKIVKEVVGDSKTITDDHLIKISGLTKWPFSYLDSKCRTGKDLDKRSREKLRACISIPPYNIELKKLCWKLGESFVKVSGKSDSLYGRMYKDRKAFEITNNEKGLYAEEAARILASKNFSKDTATKKQLESGKLSLGHIEARAKRYAVKMFISHLFECMYLDYYKKPCPTPYPINYMGHVDYIGPEVPYTMIK